MSYKSKTPSKHPDLRIILRILIGSFWRKNKNREAHLNLCIIILTKKTVGTQNVLKAKKFWSLCEQISSNG